MRMRSWVACVRKAAGALLVLTAVAGSAIAGGPLPPTAVPEIDPGSAVSALALLSSGVLMLTDRIRRR